MRLAPALVLVLVLSACSSSDPAEPTADPAPPVSPSSVSPSSAEPSSGPTQPPTPTEQETTLPPRTDSPSLPNLMRADFDGRGLRILRTEYATDAYTRYQVTYRSNGTVVSGVLLRPRGKGPFPAVVLNHGYFEPSIYVTGQGMAREQDWLARAGFVVLHTDYRGHAAGDAATDLERELRLAYAQDSINAVLALEKLPYVDDDKTAMVGRSMGGGVTLNALVAAPGLVDAAVIYASVSSRYLDNLRHFTEPNRPEAVASLYDRFGRPPQAVYTQLSSRTYFDRITEPVLIHHGEVDGTCPPAWSRTTQRLLDEAGVDSTLLEYPGEDHTFYARWQDSIVRTVRFLRAQLDV
ncbi:S9 family peptidase [Nocardioides sp. SR21]|uniref:alpha/beta hydrolase family protein n=1 Tax=Nocardioides sp. SR21 TaxID=2919501 RepID=UPI001FAAAE47|nr:alpha/beta fold hydrolase [Nocardioides sp. SR21]